MTRPSPLLSLCLLLALAACADPSSGDPSRVTYASSLGVDLGAMTRSTSGLYTQDLTVGSGTEARTGSYVQVHYSGWLPDGSLFDSSLAAGRTPFIFKLGAGEVIAGWDEGVLGMKMGGKRRLVLPASLGYGDQGNARIPPYSVLIFDVELLSAR